MRARPRTHMSSLVSRHCLNTGEELVCIRQKRKLPIRRRRAPAVSVSFCVPPTRLRCTRFAFLRVAVRTSRGCPLEHGCCKSRQLRSRLVHDDEGGLRNHTRGRAERTGDGAAGPRLKVAHLSRGRWIPCVGLCRPHGRSTTWLTLQRPARIKDRRRASENRTAAARSQPHGTAPCPTTTSSWYSRICGSVAGASAGCFVEPHGRNQHGRSTFPVECGSLVLDGHHLG